MLNHMVAVCNSRVTVEGSSVYESGMGTGPVMTTMTDRLWILGASDPEMTAIEALLRECGECCVHAATPDERRVHPGNAYRDDLTVVPGAGTQWTGATDGDPSRVTVYTVECALPPGMEGAAHVIIDHHRPGDPGFGRPPAEFLAASSIGQVVAELARLGRLPWPTVDIPRDIVLAAAADHCLGAAYRGECPGVDPDEIMRWRVASRAAFQGRTEETILADIDAAREALRTAPLLTLRLVCRICHPGMTREQLLASDAPDAHRYRWGGPYCPVDVQYHAAFECVECRDARRPEPIPELPEAATRDGIAYVSGPLIGPDGRRKYTCSGRAEHVEAFMRVWGPAQGLVDIYGDPERGFAGGYAP